MIQTIVNSELVKRSVQKKWNLDHFLEEASQREEINQPVKDMKEYFKISKSGMNQRIFHRVASGAEEGTRKRNRRDLPENETTRRKRKRKAKALVTVERQ